MARTHELKDRITKCEKILETDPSSQIFAALADAHRKKGELDRAFRICQNGLKIHPSYGSAHVVMSKINLDRGLYDWAETEAQKAVKIDGATRSIELLLAEIYLYRGEFNSALKLLNRLHEADPDNDQINKMLDLAHRIPEEQTVLMGDHESEDTGNTIVESIDTGTRRLNMSEVISQSVTVEGIDGALFLNGEGLVVEAEWPLKWDQTVCAATLGNIGSLLDREPIQNTFGTAHNILIETDDSIFYIARVADGVFIFAAAGSTNLGTLRMKIDNMLLDYQQSS
ncbi:MAG: hypothetical protein ABII79_12835 [bacterium]